MTGKLFFRTVFPVLACACAQAIAANLTGDAPLAHFKGKDQALFEEALHAVLDKGDEGTRRTWNNPETKAQGEVKALKSFTRGESTCRSVFVSNNAQGRTSAQDYIFCRSAKGKWTLAQ